MTSNNAHFATDIETGHGGGGGSASSTTSRGSRHRRRRRRRRKSVSCSSEATTTDAGSHCFSDSDECGTRSAEEDLEVVKVGRDCRICHVRESGEVGNVIELGCDCKGDLGNAHKHCADTWFKIRGNTTCEICGATAVNVAGEQTSEPNNAGGAAVPAAPMAQPELRSVWHGRRVMNFLLGCMVFAFIISWLFHFKVLGLGGKSG